ncbi:hypothetical protein [Streptomyces virginiae]|uniref:hypothetical protein n=1 Tax=Streptomyces virginiae TaxID=1961 RepID=UPI0036EED795
MPAHTPTGRPVFEPADRIPALAALRSAVRRQDRAAVAAALDGLDDEDDRALACRVVAETDGSEVRMPARDPAATGVVVFAQTDPELSPEGPDRAAVFFSGLLTVACAYPWIEYLRERRRGEG